MSPAKAKAAKAKAVQLQPPRIVAVTFGIEGFEPGYLGNAYTKEAIDSLPPNPAPTEKKKGKIVDFDQLADSQRRLLKPPREGATDGFLACSLKKAIVDAGYRTADYKGTELRAQFFVIGGPDGLIPIRDSVAITDKQIGKLKGKIPYVIARPLYPAPWRATVRIQFDASCLSIDAMMSLVERAGFFMGIGAYRPEKGGEYGRFHIDRAVELIQEKMTEE
jgi:hypothetical protein